VTDPNRLPGGERPKELPPWSPEGVVRGDPYETGEFVNAVVRMTLRHMRGKPDFFPMTIHDDCISDAILACHQGIRGAAGRGEEIISQYGYVKTIATRAANRTARRFRARGGGDETLNGEGEGEGPGPQDPPDPAAETEFDEVDDADESAWRRRLLDEVLEERGLSDFESDLLSIDGKDITAPQIAAAHGDRTPDAVRKAKSRLLKELRSPLNRRMRQQGGWDA